jgi:hypothetical protein
MKKTITKIAAALAALGTIFGPFAALAQGPLVAFPAENVRFVTQFGDDDDTAGAPPPVMWVKYIGAQESGTVDLNVNALEFFSGPLGGEVINGDPGFDVNTGDVCGSANDSLDVTDTDCDTPVEVCNVINDSGANWVCVVANVLGVESLATAAEYVDPADARAKLPGGLGIFIDTTDVDTLSLLANPSVRSGPINTNTLGHGDIEFFLYNPVAGSYSQNLKDNPFSGLRFALTFLQVEADTNLVWSIQIFGRTYQGNGRVRDRLLYQRGDLTADASTENEYDWLATAPIVTAPGETLLVRIFDDALVTGRIAIAGFFFSDPR